MSTSDPDTDSSTEAKNGEDATTNAQAVQAKRWAEFRQRIEICKMYRKKLLRNWRVNVDYRRGKSLSSQMDDDGIAVNLDWSFTKTKHAALFSQVPKAHVDHFPESEAAGPWVAAFERKLNDTLMLAGVESAMHEVMPDCINAAGFGAVLVAREALVIQKDLPSVDPSVFPPQIQQEILMKGTLFGAPVPMSTVPQVMDSRYTIRRISPSDFLWPIDFTGSDFDNAPWLGYTGRLTWAEAKSRFNLDDADKQSVLGEEKTVEDRISRDYERDHMADDGKVGFDQLFYKEFQYDTDATSFKTIKTLVFIHGKPQPVIDGPWEGQVIGQDGSLIGCTKNPLRVLTLSYITDEDIPPSDSAIGRSQVNELNRGRTHMNKQRARTAPWTWFDVNRLDPTIQTALMRGIWQHAIPVQGDGSRVVGVVQQATMNQENFEFDKIAKADLEELWTISPIGANGEDDAKDEQAAFTAKLGMERARVAAFFAGIAEVLGGLMCVYEDPSIFGQGFDPSFSTYLSYSILPDSTVLLDSNQKLQQLNTFVNNYAKSGYVNLLPVMKEIAQLVGLDPNTVIAAPQPPPMEKPNISLRLTGAKDMMNPLLLAFMLQAGIAPNSQAIEQSKQLIQESVSTPQAQPPAGGVQPPPPAPPQPGDANPDMSVLPSITDRANTAGQLPSGGGQ